MDFKNFLILLTILFSLNPLLNSMEDPRENKLQEKKRKFENEKDQPNQAKKIKLVIF